MASEPRERSAPAKRRARGRVGESEGRSPSEKTREDFCNEQAIRVRGARTGRRRRAGRGAEGSGAESGEPRDPDGGRCQVQHGAGICHRAHEPARQGRQLRRDHVRQLRAAGGVEGAGLPAHPARQRQGRDLRVGKDHQRQGAELPGTVVRRPDAVCVVRDRPDAGAARGGAAARARRRPRRSEHQQPRRHRPAGRHQRRRRGRYVRDPGDGRLDSGARSPRDPPPPRRRHLRHRRQQRNDCRPRARSDVSGPQGQGRAVPALLRQLRPECARGRAQRHLRLDPGGEEVSRLLGWQSQRLRLRLQPRR